MPTEIRARIVVTPLPGAACTDLGDGHSWDNVHLGVQRGKEPTELVRADADRAVFSVTLIAKTGADWGGPYVQGRKDDRFVYLTWGTSGDPDRGGFGMFRRAKLMLAAIPPEVAGAVRDGGRILEGRLSGVARDGGPACAAIRPPIITWRALSR